jgi:hypothetical protein
MDSTESPFYPLRWRQYLRKSEASDWEEDRGWDGVGGVTEHCRWCRNLDLPTGVKLKHKLQSFLGYALDTACPTCKLIRDGLQICDAKRLKEIDQYSELVIRCTESGGLHAFVFDMSSIANAANDLQIQFYTSSTKTWHPFIQYGDPQDSTAAEASFRWIRRVLNDCRSHKDCQDQIKTLHVPLASLAFSI